MGNIVHLLLDQPIGISGINFWNYSKTPKRGLREIEIYLDENMIYKGFLRKSPTEAEFRNGKSMLTSIVFTKDEEIIRRLSPQMYNEDGAKQTVLFNNEGKSSTPMNKFDVRSLLLERPDTHVRGVE
eukprot:TRINITY_DN17768_c0_g1_i1.p1 TRINITY_DN17768_c0_g1~~TRINITY_DN17768_c0_g1_i1.p1  ORF type:complete len:127 (+),score=19.82 TRINITY_DN17768_c0_g1_i1:91-471(+)